MKIRHLLLVLLLTLASFVVGVFWAEKKMWPYQWLGQVEDFVVLRNRLFRPETVVESSFTTLELSTFIVGNQQTTAHSANSDLSIARSGGGIYAFDNKILIMSYRGEFFLYETVNGEKSISKLNINIDNDYDSFQDFATRNSVDARKAAKAFRFMDVVYQRQTSPPALLVSHHQWHQDDECYTLRLSKLSLQAAQALDAVSAEAGDWQTIYDTTPCLPMKTKTTPFAGRDSGGRIVMEDSSSVLFTIGDHDFDGWNSVHIHAQDQTSDYGKIIRVDLESGAASHVSVGNRNPQGLLIDDDGNIWATEHGPQGGDELNIIHQNENYGWPNVTYGSEYGSRLWPLSEDQNRHDGYARPVFTWIPSIGISNLIQVKGFAPEWDGDLLVSSLRQRALHRIRYREGRVIFDESIHIGLRIRDIDQLADGTIVLWTDDTTIIEIRPSI